ncbi:FkbM family methyltransferase [Pseudarthrobacter sp. J1738]|uniref:FkbM family methyltransferase n=1 Tax=Pseudarthrobacter sp. J1738 TaxID=3420446 RepID=UPI003D293484
MLSNRTIQTTTFEVRGKAVSISGDAEEYIFKLVQSHKSFYEKDLLDVLATLPLRDGLIVDVGANLGNHTVYFGTFMENSIVAIEPVESNFELLLRNIRDNKLQARVQAVNTVVWDQPGQFSMDNPNPSNGGTFQAHPAIAGAPAISGQTLDEIISDRPVSLIKIDVEGAEDKVLAGGMSIIRKDFPVVVAESHSPEAYRKVAALLLPEGYEIVAQAGRSTNYLWVHSRSLKSESAPQLRHRLEVDNQKSATHLLLSGIDRISRKLTAMDAAFAATTGESGDLSRGTAGEIASLKLEVASLLEGQLSRLLELNASAAERHDLLANTGKAAAEDLSELKARLDDVAARISDNATITDQICDTTLKANNLLELAKSEISEHIFERFAEFTADARTQWDSQRNDLQGVASSVEASKSAVDIAVSSLNAREATKSETKLNDKLERSLAELELALDEREVFEIAAISWQRAFSNLATKWEKANPGTLSAKAAMASVQEVIARRGGFEALAEPTSGVTPAVRELEGNGFRRTETVRIGIATMPGREPGLRTVINSLLPQADEIFVYLNGMDEVPTGIVHDSRVRFFTGPDYGDRGKFLFVEDFTGYYLTCDDDIEYPDFYVDYMIDGIERYGRKAIVGWHGSIFGPDFEDYYNSKYRQVLSFSTLRGKDTPVHLLGTGIAGFHTSTMPVLFEDFEYPNMADAFLARKAQQLKVPMVVLRHERGWAIPIDAKAPSISNASLGKGEAVEKFDVRSHVTKVVKDHGRWQFNVADQIVVREPLQVAIIGRTDRERWKKGGILKSCHLTASMLRQFGVGVTLEDIETGDPENLSGTAPSVVMIYVGDPERPDFVKVERLIDLHAKKGRVVILNLSVNGKTSRNQHIRDRFLGWEKLYGNRVVLMVFTESMVDNHELTDIKHLITPIPKTLSLPSPPAAEFHKSEGIFVGDIAKLSDDGLMTHPAKEWLSAIRRAVPEATIYGVRQYKPRYDVPLDVDVVWPFLREDFSEKVSAMRLMVTPIKYATFEMVPVEVAALGVPVVYQEMPQSLSEYLGLAGVRVDTPEELEACLPILYRDPLVWRGQSRAGRLRAQSADLQSAAGQMYMRIATLAKRARF